MTAVENISLSGFYEGIIENAESSILLLDDQFRIVALNQGLYWVFLESYDVQLRKGENLFDLMSAAIPELSAKWKMRCMAAKRGLSISDEEEFVSQGQSFFWKIYYKAVKVGDSDFVSIFSRNITSTKLFQNRISKHEANLRTIINSFSSSIWLVNDQLDLIDYNERTFVYFLDTYGIRLLPTRNFIDLLPASLPELREMWLERMQVVLHSKEQTSFLDHRMTAGQEIICETRIIPVIAEGKVIGLTLSMEDITKRRIDEQLQRTQMNELLKLNTELDKFVYSASHDLRAPLLSIKGVVNLMKKEYADTIYLKHIESSITKLDHFVANIINYSRNSKLEVLPAPVDFSSIIESAIDSLSYLEGAAIVKCVVQTHNQEIPYHCDADRLLVIFKNIISNSFQYFDPWKSSMLHVDIVISEASAVITFADNGIGIQTDIMERAFDMFFRGSDRSGGSGLGLYIAKTTVEKLNGKIILQSTLGLGTTVEVEIPNLFVKA